SICALDEQEICTGGQRPVSEITQWSRMSNDERRVVLGLSDERARASGLMWTVREAR
ncbi:DUF1289 domain-containing protein, partial [Pseudomonas syringae group genomosp. 7]|uniref:DUF1289 domain-containing protein n=1 Tax=Pseudomonas syringae group genomosp. 7 TaxID=251699 RepID=UPI0037700011